MAFRAMRLDVMIEIHHFKLRNNYGSTGVDVGIRGGRSGGQLF